jgi:hypothetical protein
VPSLQASRFGAASVANGKLKLELNFLKLEL